MAPNNDEKQANAVGNVLTVEKKGKFFEDSFFDDEVRDKFERAVSTILEKAGESTSSGDNMALYRKLRQQDLKKETQAGTMSYGEEKNMIAFDVYDFNQDDIKVQVMENNTIQITGHGNSDSTQSFQRQFTIPGNVNMTLATSNISSDGILTVTIPREAPKPVISTIQMDSEICPTFQCSNEDKINSGTSMTIRKSGESMSSIIDKNTRGAINVQTKLVTIRKRGNFFEDSLFADIRECFESAVRRVLQKVGESSSSGDYMTSYRNLRQRDLQEENQAATVSHGDKEHKIVLDVNDFMEGDIEVKIMDENQVQITGTTSTRSFHRQFTLRGLPGTIRMAMATSNLSSDGILTVIIPRLEENEGTSKTNKDDICKESSISSQAFTVESSIGANLSSSHHKNLDVYSGDEDFKLNKERNEHAEAIGDSLRTLKSEYSKSALASLESSTKSGIENNLSMTILKRGNFFEDSFFAGVRTNFTKTVSEVLAKFGEISSVGDDITSYRNLRQRDLKDENQAATTSFGDIEHKIVIDVYDFMKGDIKVNIIDTNRVTITGTFETISFHRQFTLPGLPGTISMTLATASLSSDGILTVIIPRVVEKEPIVEKEQIKKDNVCKESTLVKEVNKVIQKKGKFFEDSFFGSVQDNFKKTMGEIVKNCGESLSSDSMQSYRYLRQRSLLEENRAVTVSQYEKQIEIILDLHDFTEEDIKIKTVDNTIEVTGILEIRNGKEVSTQSFHRHFNLPGSADMASVTSCMSSDGILTITVPTSARKATTQHLQQSSSCRSSQSSSSTVSSFQASSHI